MERIDCIYELVTESFTQSILKPHCCLLLRDSAVDSAVAFIVTVEQYLCLCPSIQIMHS